MPLQKSTGRVASMTRTAPVGPITRQPTARRSPPRSRRRRHPGAPAPSRRRSPAQCPPPRSAGAYARLRACRRLVAVQRFGPGRHDDGRNERPLGRAGQPAARQPTPAEQLLGCQAVATRDAADRVPVHITFLNDRSLLGRGETAAPPPPGEHVEALRPLRHLLELRYRAWIETSFGFDHRSPSNLGKGGRGRRLQQSDSADGDLDRLVILHVVERWSGRPVVKEIDGFRIVRVS